MKPTTAVIFAAGIGTRMLPITAAVQKELLPIGNRPVIDYIVEDLVAAGITRIIFVIRSGQFGLKDYYLGNAALTRNLTRLGKTEALEQLAAIHEQATFEFVEQSETAGYGTAIPLQTALNLLNPSESVVVCGGDDVIWHPDHTSEFRNLIEAYIKSGAEGAVMALEDEGAQTATYGVISTRVQDNTEYLTDITEKPPAEQASRRLVNISKYILNGAIRDFVQAVEPRPENSESYITDAIVAAAREHKIVVHNVTGKYLDTGNPENWLAANQIVAAASKSQKQS